MRISLRLAHPITAFEYDVDETDLQAKGYYVERWIPVSERLPEGQVEVIVSCRDDAGDTSFDYTSFGFTTADGEYWIVDNEFYHYVVAWMPLPEPYKEDSDES